MLNKGFRIKEVSFDKDEVKRFASAAGISTALARVLMLRGINDENKYEGFISGEPMLDPFLLLDMEKGARRVLSAVEKGENILIFGDYDADGVTSVALLYLYLESLGARVSYYIPSRLTEGYGMNISAIEEAKKSGVTLIVTVDTGITAVAEIEYAAELGIDVVVTDHHECQELLPEAAVALIDPKRQENSMSLTEYAGVGVALKLASAVEALKCGDSELASLKIIEEYADIAAIGTVADIMSLTGENRFIVKRGIEKISSGSCRGGITALLDASQKKGQKNVTAKSIAFTIAPRINAAGRMGDAVTALKLLLCHEPYECEALAGELCRLNIQRQSEETGIMSSILSGEGLQGFEKDRVIVLGSEGWHHGVIGIVCSKILDYYKKPVILLSYEDDMAKGSCRSVEGFNIVKALEHCAEHLERFGGHDLAAGVTLKKEKVEAFRRAINEYAETLPEIYEDGGEWADIRLSGAEATLPLALELKKLEPYGKDNPEPVFVLEDCKVMSVVPLSMGKHTKLILKSEGICLEGLLFSKNAERMGLEAGQTVTVLFTLEINEFMGKRNLSLNIKDLCFEGEYGRWLLSDSDREYAKFICGGDCGDLSIKPPCRDDFVRLYGLLKTEAGYEGENLSYRRMSAGIYGATYFEIRTMLDVFSEAGLLKLSLADDYGAHVALIKASKKADIEATPTFIRLKEKSKE